jgi:hypothetical protein
MHAILSTRIILQTRKAASKTKERPIEGVPLSDLHFLTREDFSEGTETTKMTATTSIEEEGRGESQYQSDVLAPPNQNENV